MHMSSETVGSLAAALARAQQELRNPEKSLTGQLPTVSPREQARSFRYASLASGLEIIRKSLGRQEIAAIQTTAIDKEIGLVRLTTVLAHSSGEWVSSEWPVCPVADAADPQRMGAALTYARRYALFTLVGIAGEDDLDAPELARPTAPLVANSSAPFNGGHRRASGSRSSPPTPNALGLAPANSAALRDTLIRELASLTSTEGLTQWAHRRLPAKNELQIEDAGAVERAFQARLDACCNEKPQDAMELTDRLLTETAAEAPQADLRTALKKSLAASRSKSPQISSQEDTTRTPHRRRRGEASAQPSKSQPRTAVDKSVLVLQEPRRIRDKEHLRYVASQPCLLCSTKPSDAHHVRFAQPKALGRKVSDEWVVPLCRQHHRDLHESGNEAAWWHDLGIDPIEIARQLWHETSKARARQTRIVPADATGPTVSGK